MHQIYIITLRQTNFSTLDIEQTLCKDILISDTPFLSQSIKRHPFFKAISISSALTA